MVSLTGRGLNMTDLKTRIIKSREPRFIEASYFVTSIFDGLYRELEIILIESED